MSSQKSDTTLTMNEAVSCGMVAAVMARDFPDHIAVIDGQRVVRYAQFNARINQLLHFWASLGLRAGDAIALFSTNCVEFIEVYAAALRGGYRFTPINWHLKPQEVAYIVENCEAKLLIAHHHLTGIASPVADTLSEQVRLVSIGTIAGFMDYESALEGQPDHNPTARLKGFHMLYTSGTTGRPKGVYRAPIIGHSAVTRNILAMFDANHTEVFLLTGPAYHGGPLASNINTPLDIGATIVLTQSFDAERTLALIARHKVTLTHFVPIMFQRLLALPESTRTRYDLSSLRGVMHGAAPTPQADKRAMIDWLGPIIWEYYGGTEGTCCAINSTDWLERPGSVGKIDPIDTVQIRNDDGDLLPNGETGTIYIETSPEQRFVYFKDPDKTSTVYSGKHFTLGDMGYLDADGFLYLSGRTSELIISGGVNIYPAETDAALSTHPSVEDVATIGVPSSEWGEDVMSVVQLRAGVDATDDLKQELISFVRSQIAHFKAPKKIEFVPNLPRRDDGKIIRRKVWAQYQ